MAGEGTLPATTQADILKMGFLFKRAEQRASGHAWRFVIYIRRTERQLGAGSTHAPLNAVF